MQFLWRSCDWKAKKGRDWLPARLARLIHDSPSGCATIFFAFPKDAKNAVLRPALRRHWLGSIGGGKW